MKHLAPGGISPASNDVRLAQAKETLLQSKPATGRTAGHDSGGFRTASPPVPAVTCRDLWKIYGAKEQDVLTAARQEGFDKQEILKRFGAVVGVAGVTFSVARGEVFCVMGLSGSGKSTLVRHINRLIEPTSGEITIDGREITALSTKQLRQLRAEKIGMVFQNMSLFPHRNVLDNVAYGLEIRGMSRKERYDRAEKVLALVQLSGWEARYPDELSGGMQQRVGLARALAVDPDILLLDEPFSALDPLIRRQLQGEFLNLSRAVNKTTIFITHDFDEAVRLGDRIAIMRDGRFVQVGTPEQIITAPEDSYVCEFTEGVSRLRFIQARSIMTPIDAAEIEAAGTPRATTTSTIDELIGLALQSSSPITVVDETGMPVGTITKDQILKSLKGSVDSTRRGANGAGRS